LYGVVEPTATPALTATLVFLFLATVRVKTRWLLPFLGITG
jgi:hypothetical protein